MSRMFRILMVAACTLAIVGVGTAMACDSAKQASASSSCSAKQASAEKASSSSSCAASAKMASAGSCAAKAEMANAGASHCNSEAMKACLAQANCPMGNGCCAKTAMALSNYEPFTFVKQASAQNVAVGVSSTDNGFSLVFAGLTANDVAMAKKLAAEGVASMNAPAHCAMTRGAMAEKVGGCESGQACLKALANAEIVLTETEQGAVASITSKDEAKVKELHALLAQVAETPASEGSE